MEATINCSDCGTDIETSGSGGEVNKNVECSDCGAQFIVTITRLK